MKFPYFLHMKWFLEIEKWTPLALRKVKYPMFGTQTTNFFQWLIRTWSFIYRKIKKHITVLRTRADRLAALENLPHTGRRPTKAAQLKENGHWHSTWNGDGLYVRSYGPNALDYIWQPTTQAERDTENIVFRMRRRRTKYTW